MEALFAVSIPISTWIESEKIARKNPIGFSISSKEKKKRFQMLKFPASSRRKSSSIWDRQLKSEVSCCYKKFPASTLESGNFHTSFHEALKNKSQAIQPYLNGRCIYLVGMMGSGKTTVGKILSEVLGYSFFDSDKLIENSVDGTSVSEIFQLYGEGFFREKETEALRELSLAHCLVVSTGGGAVVRPINWKYMHKGISVWLDVPLEALAQRIAAVGVHSRPLLHHGSGDAYTKALIRLSTLLEERGDAYATANARVSLEHIAAKLGHLDVSNLTPTIIAFEALQQIEGYLKEEDSRANSKF